MGFHAALCQVWLVLAVLAVLALLRCDAAAVETLRTQSRGPRGLCGEDRYWSAAQHRCLECTSCSGPGREVTLRPCDGRRDAKCGSVKDLHMDWSWLKAHHTTKLERRNGALEVRERIHTLSEAEALVRDELRHLPKGQHLEHDKLIDFGEDYILPDHPRQPPKKHRKNKKGHLLKANKPFGDYDFADFGASGEAETVSDDEDLARVSWRRTHRHRAPASTAASTTTTSTTTARPTTPVSLVEDFIVVKDTDREDNAELGAGLEPQLRGDDVVVATTQTFTTAETLVWDWQAGVLVAAVCACLLFFVVAAAYSCQHALHFKKLKKHLDADMEEISARLALMSGMASDNLNDPGAPVGVPTSEKDSFSVRRGDHLRTGRQQNEYCLATLPRKSRV